MIKFSIYAGHKSRPQAKFIARNIAKEVGEENVEVREAEWGGYNPYEVWVNEKFIDIFGHFKTNK